MSNSINIGGNQYKNRDIQPTRASYTPIKSTYTPIKATYTPITAKNVQMQQMQQAYMQAQQPQQKSNTNWFLRLLATPFELTSQVLQGASKAIEGLVDFGASIVGGVGGLFNKDFQSGVQSFIEEDWTGKGANAIGLDKLSEASYFSDMGAVGDTITGVANGVGQLLPNVVLALATGGTSAGVQMAVTATSAMGKGTEKAYQEGADYYRGMAYGAVSGGVEALTEKMFGGATKNLFGKGMLDGVTKSIGTSGASKVIKEMLQEGIEEATSEFVDPLLQNIYKDKGFFEDFLTKEHLGNIAQSAIIGAGTSAIASGTIGQIHKNKQKASESLHELQTLAKKEQNLFAKGELFAGNNQSKIDMQRQQIKEELSTHLQRMQEKTRAKFIEQYKLDTLVDKDGKLLIPTENTQVEQTTTLDKRYYSPKFYGKEQAVEQMLQAQGAKVYSGELTSTESKNYTKAKTILNQLAKKGLVRGDIILADSNAKFDAYVDGKTVVLSKDTLSNDSWRQKLVHEVTHFAEGSKEYAEFAKYIIGETDIEQTTQEILGKDYGIKAEDIESIADILSKGNELTPTQKRYISELVAHKAGELLGNETSIDKLVKGKRNLAQKIYDKIKQFIKVITTKSPQERALLKQLYKAESLYKKALESTRNQVDNSVKYSLKDNEKESDLVHIADIVDDIFAEFKEIESLNKQENTEQVKAIIEDTLQEQVQQVEKDTMTDAELENFILETAKKIDEELREAELLKENESIADTVLQQEKIKVKIKEKAKLVLKAREGEVQRHKAEYRKNGKVYQRKDAQAIANTLATLLVNEETYQEWDANLKNKNDITEYLYIALNKAKTEAERVKYARQIADIVIDNAVFKDINVTGQVEEAKQIVEALKQYRKNLRLDSLKGEINYKYDKQANSIIMQWGNTQNVADKFGVDQVAQELQELGIHIEAENDAEIFFEIVDIYENARDTLLQAKEEYTKDILTEAQNQAIKEEITTEILKSYDKFGQKSTLAKELDKLNTKWSNRFDTLKESSNRKIKELIDKYTHRVDKLKREKAELIIRDKAEKRLTHTIKRIKEIEGFKSASDSINIKVQEFIKLVGKMGTYLGNISSDVRTVLGKYVDLEYLLKAKNEFYLEESPFLDIAREISLGSGELSIDEMQYVNMILESFIHDIKSYDMLYWNGKNQQESELIVQGTAELAKVFKRKTNAFKTGVEKFVNWTTNPINYIRKMTNYNDNSVLMQMYNELQKGANEQYSFTMKKDMLFADFFKKHKKEIKTWRDGHHEIDGVKLSKAQAIELVLLSRREQAQAHLWTSEDGQSGIIRVTSEQDARKGKAREALQNGKDITITKADIESLYNSFTVAQKEYVDLAHSFFNELAKNAKIETDKKIYGVSTILDSNDYIPIRVADDQIWKKMGETNFKDLFSVYNPSFNKKVKANAKNKIVVENIIDTVERHAKQMGKYYGLAPTIHAIDRLFNRAVDGKRIRTELDKIDPEFVHYFSRLLKDVQGVTEFATDLFSRVVGKTRSMMASASLGANPKVWFNQVASLPASTAVGLKYKHLMKGLGQHLARKTDTAKLFEYVPMAYERYKSGSNADVGLLKEKVLAGVNRISDFTTAPIQYFDKVAISAIWNASLEQTKNSKTYEPYSDEHYKKAAELTEKAITLTQPNYTALQRPEILRSKNELLRLSTMFMTQPLQNLSLLTGGIDEVLTIKKLVKVAETDEEKAQLQKQLKEANKRMWRGASAVAVETLVIMAVAQAFKYLLGQNKEEAKELTMDIVNDFTSSIIGMFPIAKDIYTIFQGHDLSNFAYSGLTNLVNSVQELYNIAETLAKVASGKLIDHTDIAVSFRKIIINLSTLFGLPVKNVERYFKGILTRIDPATAYKYNSLFYDRTQASYTKALKKAIEKGDDRLADTILDTMLADEKLAVRDAKVRKEMRTLYAQGLDVFPKSVGASITYDDETITFTNKQYKQFMAEYDKANNKVTKLVNSAEYKTLEAKEKASSIKYIYNAYYQSALKNLLAVDIDDKSYLFSKAIDIATLAPVIAKTKNIEADTDANGQAIAGSKKAKVIAYIESLKLSAVQKYMLVGYLGYKNTNASSQAVARYIESLALTKNEKQALYAYCGY